MHSVIAILVELQAEKIACVYCYCQVLLSVVFFVMNIIMVQEQARTNHTCYILAISWLSNVTRFHHAIIYTNKERLFY